MTSPGTTYGGPSSATYRQIKPDASASYDRHGLRAATEALNRFAYRTHYNETNETLRLLPSGNSEASCQPLSSDTLRNVAREVDI
jgi:hypothetical protein